MAFIYKHGRTQLPPLTFTENGVLALELPRNRKIRRITLDIGGTITLSSGSASGAVLANAMDKLFPGIKVTANGNHDFYGNIDAELIRQRNTAVNGVANVYTQPADGSATTNTVRAIYDLDFQSVFTAFPNDTLFPADRCQSLYLYITCGTLAGMFTAANDRTKASALTIRVYVEDTDGPEPKYLIFRDYQEKVISASTTSFPLDLVTGERAYLNSWFKTNDTGIVSDSILNGVSFGVDSMLKLIDGIKSANLKAEYYRRFGLAPATGFYYLDHTDSGLMTTGVPANGITTLRYDLDVSVGSGTTLIRCYNEYIVKPEKIFG